MSKSLWEITSELQSIINDIEEQGGEFTEEQSEALAITKDNFAEKIKSYCAVIDKYNSYIDACKAEKKRVNELQKTRSNVVEKLKNVLLDTIMQFGNNGKSGNKVLELDTRKLYTKNTESLDIDYDRTNTFIIYCISYIKELYANGVLDGTDDEVLNSIVNAINAIAKSELGPKYESYTVNDFKSAKIKVTVNITLSDLIDKPELLSVLNMCNETEFSVDKDKIKFLSKEGDVTIAKYIKKPSLIIK